MPEFENDADRLALLTELGDDVVYTPNNTGIPVTIKMYVDLTVELQNVATGAVTGAQPMGEGRTYDPPQFMGDLTGNLEDGLDTILFQGVTYLIKEPKDDGTGMTEVLLEEQA